MTSGILFLKQTSRAEQLESYKKRVESSQAGRGHAGMGRAGPGLLIIGFKPVSALLILKKICCTPNHLDLADRI